MNSLILDYSSLEEPDSIWNDPPSSIIDATSFIFETLKNNNVEIIINHNPCFDEEHVACTGYFSDPFYDENSQQHYHAVVAFCTLNDWQLGFPILVHEFNHFNQCQENSYAWDRAGDCSQGMPAWHIVDNYMKNSNKNNLNRSQKYKIARAFYCLRDLEQDCEERVVSFIKKHQLPINTEEYTQKANAYVLYYHFIEKHGYWYDKDCLEPKLIPEMWKQCPKTFGDHTHCSEALMKTYEKYYLKK
jgi:hypothetical protein